MKPTITALVLLLGAGTAAAAASNAAQPPDTVRPAHSLTVADTADSDSTDSLATADTIAAKKPKKHSSLDTLRYDATVIHYDLPKKILHLNGNAVALYRNLTMYADTIIYHIDESLFEAVGKPKLIEGGDTTVGEYMTYNTKTKRGRVQYATDRMSDAYFDGHRIVKSAENNLYIDQGDYTTCAYPDHPHYYFYAKNIKVIPGDKTISRPVVLNIGEVPIAALPYFIMPLDHNRRSGWLTPGWGGQPTGGGYLDNVGYYWAPNDYFDLKGAGKIQEFTSYVLTAQSNYALRYWMSGGLNLRYTLGNGYNQSNGEVSQDQNWAVDYSHSQQLLPDGSFTLAGSGSLVSDRNFYRNFSEDTTELLDKSQSISANMALTKRFNAINASVQAVWNRTQDMVTSHLVEDIPSITFSLPSRPLFPYTPPENASGSEADEPKWFQNITYGYNARGVVKRDQYTNDSLPGFIKPGLDQSLNISAPTKILKYFTINPSFNARMSTFYGYMDTAVQKSDTVHDTVRVTVSSIAYDTITRYKSYTIIDSIRNIVLDTTNQNSTVYDTTITLVKQGPARLVQSYDTLPKSGSDLWSGFKNDYSWNAGVSLSTKLYGLFPIHLLSLTGIRHTVTPSVSYTFFPAHQQAYRFYPIDISADGARKQGQVAGISLDNLFEGKAEKPAAREGDKPTETKFTILTLGLSTSYDFQRDSLKWSDLALNAATSFSVVRVSFSSDFWLYDQHNAMSFPILRSYRLDLSPNNFAVGGTFWDGDLKVLNKAIPDDPVEYATAGPQAWRINLSPSYSFSAIRETPSDLFVTSKQYSLTASAALNFTRNWNMSWSSTYDFTHNMFVGHSLSFLCDLECWNMRFDWRPSGINPGYYFLINVKKLPEIKWELRS